MHALTRYSALMSLLVAVALSLAPSTARADTEEELKKKIADQQPQVTKQKDAGKIGETAEGYLAAVKEEYLKEAEVKKLVDEANDNRRKVYAIIAKRQNTTVEAVAAVAGARNIKGAKAGHYVKGADGKWVKVEKDAK